VVVSLVVLVAGWLSLRWFIDAPPNKIVPVRVARSGMAAIRFAVQEWSLRTETCPTVPQLISAGRLDAERGLLDPWGNPYRVDCAPTGRFEDIRAKSAGPDGKWGTWDDESVPDTVPPRPAQLEPDSLGNRIELALVSVWLVALAATVLVSFGGLLTHLAHSKWGRKIDAAAMGLAVITFGVCLAKAWTRPMWFDGWIGPDETLGDAGTLVITMFTAGPCFFLSGIALLVSSLRSRHSQTGYLRDAGR